MELSLSAHFSKALGAAPQRLHFAAHSHHLWPDVTFEAQQAAWLDAARLADLKWGFVLETLLPRVQAQLAQELSLPRPDALVFAPNTHELVVRLLSCLEARPTIVTTDAEFHSFERQTRRLEEESLARVIRVATQPFSSLGERLSEAVRSERPQLLFLSQVFFDSGFVFQGLEELVLGAPSETVVCIDGYHGFCAVPTSLQRLASRAFYLAGGYKYVMAGEGCCFLAVPPGFEGRPRNTGWFAAFGALEQRRTGEVPYAPGGAAFMGSTFDPSGLYRLDAALRWRQEIGLTTAAARAHAHTLQRRLLESLRGPLADAKLLVASEEQRGHFLAFEDARARRWCDELKSRDVITDARGDRLRIGFGVYHTSSTVDALAQHLSSLRP